MLKIALVVQRVLIGGLNCLKIGNVSAFDNLNTPMGRERDKEFRNLHITLLNMPGKLRNMTILAHYF